MWVAESNEIAEREGSPLHTQLLAVRDVAYAIIGSKSMPPQFEHVH